MFNKSVMARRAGVVAATVAVGGLLLAPSASADTRTGWVGSTGPVGGNLLLHTSTVSNTPLFADTRVYTAFGNTVPSATMGVRSRLFTSGALCVIKPYKFNSGPASSLNDPTTGDCGPGFYNSHGFVRAWNGTAYQEFVTFPSDPLQWGAAARSADDGSDAAVTVNDNGQTIGSAEGITDDAQLPELVSAFGTDGQRGYVRSSDIVEPDYTLEQAQALPDNGQGVLEAPARTVPLYDDDGATVLGEFSIG
ncbi:hypothetical protein CH262_23145 [Rhodococcus sp. 05-2255-1e]|nr:hypothetical protein CH262_23145 [Rhodococcus sp. 05-2255-1e]